MDVRRHRPIVGAVVLFAAVLAAGLAVARLARGQLERDERAAVATAAAAAAGSLERELARSLSATYALAALVRQHGQIADFDRLAAEMLPLYGGLSTLQLAPGGVIRQIFPLAGNEIALGHDLLRDPDRRFQASEAIRTRRLTLAGPFELRQGGVGLIGRLPVFVGAPGEERFWGFVVALVRLPGLLDASRVSRLDGEGYAWELTREQDGRRSRFAGAGTPSQVDAVEVPVAVPNGDWVLRLAPRAGWGAGRWVWLQEAAALCAALALAALAFTVLRQPEILRRQVEERTADLARTTALLSESQKLDGLGRLAGGVAHDFNNLLTVILGCAEALHGELSVDAAPREALDDVAEIRAAAERARELTAQLLAFARRQVSAPEPLDLNEVLRGTEKLLRRALGEDVRLVLTLAARLPPVVADRGQLGQVALNLAVNARDAMPTGGRLDLETADVTLEEPLEAVPPGRWVRLRVRDTGHGMTPEVLAHLFEPFFTTKPQGRGTGLGLATVYGIVKQSGGHAHVTSAPGRGTTIDLYLPPADAPAARPEGLEEGEPRGGSETVLVVEDDSGVREVTARALRSGGYDVLVASGGEMAEALMRADPDRIALLVTDVVMPGIDGRALARRLAALRPSLKVLYVSGYPGSVLAGRGVLEPRVELVAKPFTRRALLRKVRAILDA